jgi:hypothetical protein
LNVIIVEELLDPYVLGSKDPDATLWAVTDEPQEPLTGIMVESLIGIWDLLYHDHNERA